MKVGLVVTSFALFECNNLGSKYSLTNSFEVLQMEVFSFFFFLFFLILPTFHYATVADEFIRIDSGMIREFILIECLTIVDNLLALSIDAHHSMASKGKAKGESSQREKKPEKSNEKHQIKKLNQLKMID